MDLFKTVLSVARLNNEFVWDLEMYNLLDRHKWVYFLFDLASNNIISYR